uniref:Uncharacterized protein n=1 Tax=Cannabis sativa TaxID=3483 RepID=A0A803QFS6_CANSA
MSSSMSSGKKTMADNTLAIILLTKIRSCPSHDADKKSLQELRVEIAKISEELAGAKGPIMYLCSPMNLYQTNASAWRSRLVLSEKWRDDRVVDDLKNILTHFQGEHREA